MDNRTHPITAPEEWNHSMATAEAYTAGRRDALKEAVEAVRSARSVDEAVDLLRGL